MLRPFAARLVAHLVVLAALAAAPGVLLASEGAPPVLNIKTYTSPSGEYAITIDPSAMHGGGSGHYTLKRNGEVEWEKDLPYTLWEASITDAGVVGGYAYSYGLRGYPEQPGGEPNGTLITAILAPDGTERLKEVTKRTTSGVMHSAPEPIALGCFVDAANDRLVVRFYGAQNHSIGDQSWKAYRLSTGAALPDLHLRGSAARGLWENSQCVGVLPLGASGLIGVLYLQNKWVQDHWQQRSLRLVVFDRDLAELWSLTRPEEFKGADEQVGWNLRAAELIAIKAASPTELTFDLRSFGEQARITFTVKPDPDKSGQWTGSEVARVAEKVSLESRAPIPAIPDFRFGRVAFDGKNACAISADRLVIIDAATGRVRSFLVPGADKKWLYPFIAADGKEVWLLDTEEKAFARYALPKD